MKVFNSSPYVKERAKRLAAYLIKRGWFVIAGKNNCILININRRERGYSNENFLFIIMEADKRIEQTGLPVNKITYDFYYKGRQIASFTVYDTRKFDILQ